jgi:hypothetical protein
MSVDVKIFAYQNLPWTKNQQVNDASFVNPLGAMVANAGRSQKSQCGIGIGLTCVIAVISNRNSASSTR